jgi:hypothetical protein
MAKKQAESGPGPFMIVTLVFFILATLILGVTTYLGYKGQEDLEKAAADAKAAQDKAKAYADEQTTRLDMQRIGTGGDDPKDREELAGLIKSQGPAAVDEWKRVIDKVGGSLPKGVSIEWPADASGQPGAAPKQNLTAVVKTLAGMTRDANERARAAEVARKKAEGDAQAAQAQRLKDKEAFDAQAKALGEDYQKKLQALDLAFNNLKKIADDSGIKFSKTAEEWAADRVKLEETVTQRNNDNASLRTKLFKAQNPDPSDIEFKFKNWNPATMSERMGTVTERQGKEFVTLNFQVRMVLVPGQTFVAIAPNRSLVEVLEREKELEKTHVTRTSLDPREPFNDNELIKGMVEITEVTSPYTARARITHEPQQIRNPIGKGDQLFNMSLSTGEKEHVAFAGIIDLDGDGRPDNEAFIRILERNNLIVDAYLDLKTGEIKGKGMSTATRFLIIGSDAPAIGNLKKMVGQAKELGVQQIDARLFLNLIGVKPPRHPAPPAYAGVNLGPADGSGPAKDGDMPPMPPAEPKKE